MSDLERENKFRSMREAAREIFRDALANASIARGFARHVNCERGVLRVGDDLYDLHSYSRVFVLSLGKAAHNMVDSLSYQIGPSREGIVASSVQPAAQIHGFRYFCGGHPTPNAESMLAASAMVRALAALPAAALVIFLLSGGGSSIVEKPIDDEISLDDLIATYRVLVHSGAPIAEINVTITSLQLANFAWILNRELKLDTSNGSVVDDAEARKLWSREYEKGWEPKV